MCPITLLLILVAGCVSAELCDTEPELREVGRDLAAKAAAFYAERYFPGSSVGPGEPVYDITDEETVVGWYFIVDTMDIHEFTFHDYQELNTEMYKNYMEPFLTGVYSEENNDILEHHRQMKRYKSLYISNLLTSGPLYWREDGPIPPFCSVPEQMAEISREYDTTLVDWYRLFSLPNSPYISVCYKSTEGVRIYAYQNIDWSDYYEQDNLEGLIKDFNCRWNEHFYASLFQWKSLRVILK